MLLPNFNELGRTDLSLAFVPQRRILVFSLFILSLFADIHKLMSSIDVEILSSNESIWLEGGEQYSWVSSAYIYIHDKKVCGHR